jgi:hypothetical protein
MRINDDIVAAAPHREIAHDGADLDTTRRPGWRGWRSRLSVFWLFAIGHRLLPGIWVEWRRRNAHPFRAIFYVTAGAGLRIALDVRLLLVCPLLGSLLWRLVIGWPVLRDVHCLVSMPYKDL